MAFTASPSIEQLLQIIGADGFFSLRDASKGWKPKSLPGKSFQQQLLTE